MGKLPKDAKIGTVITKKVKVRGKIRNMSFKKIKPHGANKNLTWKIVSNKSRSPRKKNLSLMFYLIFGLVFAGIGILIFLQINGTI